MIKYENKLSAYLFVLSEETRNHVPLVIGCSPLLRISYYLDNTRGLKHLTIHSLQRLQPHS